MNGYPPLLRVVVSVVFMSAMRAPACSLSPKMAAGPASSAVAVEEVGRSTAHGSGLYRM
jgi:hypothetical protein